MPDYSLKNLILTAQKGNEHAFNLLVETHLNLVYSLAMKLLKNQSDAEDLSQIVFLKLWKNLNSIDVNQPLSHWLSKVTKNAGLDMLKKRRPTNFSEFIPEDSNSRSFFENYPAKENSPEQTYEDIEIYENLEKKLANLPQLNQEIILLKTKQDLTFKQISKILDKPLNTIKSLFLRSLKQIKNSAPK